MAKKFLFTHNQQFHADDVFAAAILDLVFNGNIQIVRTRNPETLQRAQNDPNDYVFDVGGIFNPSMLNFDHHQDLTLPSAAGMIWEHHKNDICPNIDAQPFFGQFIASIDAIDTNRDNVYALWSALPKGFKNTSSIIGGFNRDARNEEEQHLRFHEAMSFAKIIIENELYFSKQLAVSEAQYNSREILPNNVAVFSEFSTVWKDKKEHSFAIMPHASGWQLVAADTAFWKVPESIASIEGFVFRHASGFMATGKNKEALVTFAKNM